MHQPNLSCAVTRPFSRSVFITGLLLSLLSGFLTVRATEIHVGTSTADISPKLPVALMGQFDLRIAKSAETPLYAGIIAIESKEGNRSLDTAVFVSCDLILISASLQEEVRAEVLRLIPGFNVNKIILSATHTHTAPVLDDDPDKAFVYPIPKEGVVKVKDYRDLFSQRVAAAIEKAWKSRAKGSVTWGLNRAAVGYNRRAVYKDGTTVMYGKTDKSDFQNLEGYEDHDVNSLFFWDAKAKLIAMSIDVACPAQEFEHREFVNADYWHPVRQALNKRFGADVSILGWIGAAGDQSPHSMYRKAGEARMQKLSSKTRMDDIVARITRAAEETYEIVKDDKHSDVAFSHKTEKLKLPQRIITAAEYLESKKVEEDCAAQIALDPKKAGALYAKMTWFGDVLRRFKAQQGVKNPVYETEIHVLRIGDAAICTNQFELFTDYGIRMQARSKAVQTFVIQLAGPGTYLPSAKAVSGGGYSAICQSNVVGAEGGQVLVDRTVEMINSLWP
ncbi:hypothetical protein [Dyadobacter sp. LHD-138]|uniref:hypothetical protein n=1 Tax=Dyadobacter sp. LHD-138 TaxID=3071413 RepID=UPI0027DF8FC2|nr:hypothetical protein [Dyadobacter sp. LHD-138]MDQ6477165.1 hypothetical protein [Dyadobacter sp. LHD-138]